MTTVGAYSLGNVLGHGGFATVYLATRAGSSTPFALKLLAENWSGNQSARDRFLREARIMAKIAGPGIVRIHDFGVSRAGQPFLVMDYAALGSLDKHLGALGQQLPYRAAIELALEIGAAVRRAHGFNVVHRDLKPANVLIGADDEILVADFGLARAMSEVSRPTTIAAGTLAYMAPEQFVNRADLRCDVYALGAIAYELLSGRVPFGQDNIVSVLDAKRAEDYPRLTDLRPDAPWQVAEVVHRALANDPDRRHSTAQEWVAALAAAGAADPTQPPPPTTPPTASTPDPTRSSPMARWLAMDQLRDWAELVRTGRLSATEFAQAKARKLAEVGLVRGLPRQTIHVSPYSQSLAVDQAEGMRSLVTEGVLTSDEYAIARQVILYDNRLGPPP